MSKHRGNHLEPPRPVLNGQPVIFGEVLFDEFEDGAAVLGGAPFNVAWHLQGFGLAPIFISRIGSDAHGNQVMHAMEQWGMDFSAVHNCLIFSPIFGCDSRLRHVSWSHLSNRFSATPSGDLARRASLTRPSKGRSRRADDPTAVAECLANRTWNPRPCVGSSASHSKGRPALA